MLRELRLNNLAIIKKLDLEFNDKFIALELGNQLF